MSEELKPANQHPDFGKICVHKHLKRKCYECELEEQISLQKEVIDKLVTVIKETKSDLKDTPFSDGLKEMLEEALAFAKEKLG